LHQVPLCLWLAVGTGLCASPPAPDPARVADGHSPVRQLKEGVAGRISDQDGRALEGAAVLAASIGPGGPAVPEIAIVSGADGRYEWPLRAGRYELTAVADGYRRVSKEVTVDSGAVATLDFVLSRERRAPESP
jgi:hypothetical protein